MWDLALVGATCYTYQHPSWRPWRPPELLLNVTFRVTDISAGLQLEFLSAHEDSMSLSLTETTGMQSRLHPLISPYIS